MTRKAEVLRVAYVTGAAFGATDDALGERRKYTRY